MVCGIRRELFLFILRTIADPIGDGTMGRTPHPTHIFTFSQKGFKYRIKGRPTQAVYIL